MTANPPIEGKSVLFYGWTSLYIYVGIYVYSSCCAAEQNNQEESWYRREVDLVYGFPFVSEAFFFRESDE